MTNTIKDWAEEDRPREKMLAIGAASLTKAELLAILIGSGSPTENAVELTRRILADCNNNLNTLGKKDMSELCRYKGIGTAKAITIMAACELARRRMEDTKEERPQLSTPKDVYEFMLPKMQDLSIEEAWLLMMNNDYRLLGTKKLSTGGITETAVDVRIILNETLMRKATAITLCHNHPSGACRPSKDDDNLTTRVRKACEVMRIYLADHVIVTDGNYYSYRENGRLD